MRQLDPIAPRSVIPSGVSALAVLLLAGAASASTLNLSWDECGPQAPSNRVFACDRNDGVDVVVGSIRVPYSYAHLRTVDAFLKVCFPNPPVPDWWYTFLIGTCRKTSMSANFTPGPGPCLASWAQGSSITGNVNYAYYGGGASTGSLLDIHAEADSATAAPVVAGQEYFMFNLVIDHAKTIGPGACGGCELPATVQFTFAWIYSTTQGAVGIGGESDDAVATWQNASPVCFGGVPVKNRTWGSIKTLYR